MAPTMSSARVLRAGRGMDRTISSTHLDSVAGKAVSGCGSMAPSGVWSDTRNMGLAIRLHRLEPARRLGPVRTRNSSQAQLEFGPSRGVAGQLDQCVERGR